MPTIRSATTPPRAAALATGTVGFRAGHVRMMDAGEFVSRAVARGPAGEFRLTDAGTNPAEYTAVVPSGIYTLEVCLQPINFFGGGTTRTFTAHAAVAPNGRTIVERSRLALSADVCRAEPTRPAGLSSEPLSANARMLLSLRGLGSDARGPLAPSGQPVSTPYPQWCRECVRIDPTVQPVDRLVILNGYCDYAVTLPFFRETAQRIYNELAAELGRQPTATELLTRIMESVHDLVDYLPDPDGEEIFQPVLSCVFNGLGKHVSRLTGQKRGGDDCEGLATVFVTLARILGFKASNVWWEQPGAALNHVAAQVCDGGVFPTNFGSPRCIPIETTIPGAVPGETPYEAIRRIGPAYKSRVFGEA